MNQKLLSGLVSDLEQELLRLGYTEGSMCFYRRRRKQLINYAEEYSRFFLGHNDIKTTEIYARADSELKRKALENAYPDLVDTNLPDWNENTDLMNWLSKL